MNSRAGKLAGLGAALLAGVALGWFAREWGGTSCAVSGDATVAETRRVSRLRATPLPPSAKKPPPEGASAESVASAVHAPASAAEVLRRMIEELEKPSKGRTDTLRMLGRLQQLRDMGTEGVSAMRDFLLSHEDIVFDQPAYAALGGRQLQMPSLRAAMLETLYDMGDSAAVQANLEVMRTTASGLELLLAARNLEKASPGTYRDDAIRAVGEILSAPPDVSDPRNRGNTQQVLELLAYYKARDLIPQAEQWVGRQPQLLYAWLNTLGEFAPEDQAASLRRLMEDGKTKQQLVQNPFFVAQMSFDNADIRSVATDVYVSIAQPQQRLMFVQQLAQAAFPRVGQRIMQDSTMPRVIRPSRARIEGALRFLDELLPKLDTPELQRQEQQTRQQLQAQLKSAS